MTRWGELDGRYDGQDWPDDIDDEPGSVLTSPPQPLHYTTDRIMLDRSELPPPPRVRCGRICQRLNGEPSCGQCGALRDDNLEED